MTFVCSFGEGDWLFAPGCGESSPPEIGLLADGGVVGGDEWA